MTPAQRPWAVVAYVCFGLAVVLEGANTLLFNSAIPVSIGVSVLFIPGLVGLVMVFRRRRKT